MCKRILSGALRSYLNAKTRKFVDALLLMEKDESLLAFELASSEEQEALADFQMCSKRSSGLFGGSKVGRCT